MEINKEIFPIRLKEVMEQNNQTVYTIAESLHLSAPTISRYMNGLMSPKLTAIQILANKFNIDPAWLMGYDVPKESLNVDTVKEETVGYGLTKKDEKDIIKILENMKKTLTTQEGLMFDGNPASEDDIKSILDAMQIGMEMAKKRNKDKYTPKKYKK